MLIFRKGNIGREKKEKETDLKLSLIEEQTDEEVNIELLIRERYSMSQELALHRKKAMNTVDADEWKEYCDYVEECIEKARS